MRRYLTLITFAAFFALFAVAFTTVRAVRADDRADAVVTVQNFSFTAQNVTINEGEKVTWNNISGFHNVASNDGTTFRCGPGGCDQTGGDGSAGNASWTTEFTFNTRGVYNYVCEIHAGMTGTVTVNGPNAVGLGAMDANASFSTIPILLLAVLTVGTVAVRRNS